MDAQAKLQSFLQSRFFEIQSKNPRFSLRAFSKKIGLAPGATSELLRGHRQATRKIALRVAENLMLDPQEKHELLKWFPEKKLEKKAQEKLDTISKDYLKLTADQFQLISEWVHYAILSLIGTKDFEPSATFIATRLGVTLTKATACLERLERLNLIEKDKNGNIKRTYAKIHTPDDVFSVSLQKAHTSDMEIAKNALQNVPVDLRDFTSISFPADPSLLKEAKASIRKFRDEIASLLSSKSSSEVYQMSVYVYPLTQVRMEKENEKSK